MSQNTATLPQLYRNYIIQYDPPPIPLRQFDWDFAHEDYDIR